MNYLKNIGHYIIINSTYTITNSNDKNIPNIGKKILDILDKLNITYDEIHFDKCNGDIYIDNKVFNYFDMSLFSQIGFYDFQNTIHTDFKTNKYNKLRQITKNTIQKNGLDLQGEIYFYNIISLTSIASLFPRMISNDTYNTVTMEYINGTILYKIYCEGLLNIDLLYKLLDTINTFHNTSINDNIIITKEDVYHHYYDKFINRSKILNDYPFDDMKEVTETITEQLFNFIDKNYKINNIIHGDMWFSNIFFLKGSFIFFDVRGKFNNKLTIKGHTFYDWAKIYQSIIGLDSIINYGININIETRKKIEDAFWSYLLSKNIIQLIDKEYIIKLTGYLIYNTFHAYDIDFPIERKTLIWMLVKECIYK